jgi:hypothetical protein
MKERGHVKSRVKPDRLVVEIRESKAKGRREEVRSQRLRRRQARRGHVVEGYVRHVTKCAKAVTRLARKSSILKYNELYISIGFDIY